MGYGLFLFLREKKLSKHPLDRTSTLFKSEKKMSLLDGEKENDELKLGVHVE